MKKMTQLEKLINEQIIKFSMKFSQTEANIFYSVLKEEIKIACKSKKEFWFEFDFDNLDLEFQDKAYLKRRLKTALKGVLNNTLEQWIEVFIVCYKSYKNPILFGKKF